MELNIQKLQKLILAGLLCFGLTTGTASAEDEDTIKGRYIVVLKDQLFERGVHVTASGETVSEIATRLMSSARENQMLVDSQKGIYRTQAETDAVNQQDLIYEHALSGFSASLTNEAANFLKNMPEVKYITQDKKAYTQAVQTQPPSWGLDRIDQRDLPLNNRYVYASSGNNVHIYVVDTGLDMTHPEFSGRVGNGYDFYDKDSNPNDTCRGHGTHVAGTTGGRTVGVAKNVIIHPYKVFGCAQTTSNSIIISALDSIVRDHQLPGVVNMSLGSSADKALDDAVERVIATGLTVVVAAGNNGTNACNTSPARVSDAITVAASDATDNRSMYNWGFSSNYGPCVDVVAPGSSIRSSFVRGLKLDAGCDDQDGDGYSDCDGTSMASPHVAGLAAQYLQYFPTATPTEVASAVISASSKGRLSNFLADTPNRLAYNQLSGSVTQPSIVAVAYVDFRKMACAWYENNYVSCGATTDLNSVRSAYRYSLPSGYTPNDIVDIAWVDSYHMACAFYKDGKISCGSTSDLDSIRSLYSYTLPPGYSSEDIKGIAYIGSENRACAWYSDQKVSCGTTRDLDSLLKPTYYAMPPQYFPQTIRGVAWVDHRNMECAWYSNGYVSCGANKALTGVRNPAPYTTLQ